ncbi:Fic family protein, partial [Candidatus Omnitrophota bacterium]
IAEAKAIDFIGKVVAEVGQAPTVESGIAEDVGTRRAIHTKEMTARDIDSIVGDIESNHRGLDDAQARRVYNALRYLRRTAETAPMRDRRIRTAILREIDYLIGQIEQRGAEDFVTYSADIGVRSLTQYIMSAVIADSKIAIIDGFLDNLGARGEIILAETLLHEILTRIAPERSHADHKARYASRETLPEGLTTANIVPELAGIQRDILGRQNLIKPAARNYVAYILNARGAQKAITVGDEQAFIGDNWIARINTGYKTEGLDEESVKSLRLAAEYVETLVSGRSPIALKDILELHRLGMVGGKTGAADNIEQALAGQIRPVPIESAWGHITPSPLQTVNKDANDYVEWLNRQIERTDRKEGYDPVTLAAHAFFGLVNIHPFVGGNTRTSWLILNYILRRYNLSPFVLSQENQQKYSHVLVTMKSAKDFAKFLHEELLESAASTTSHFTGNIVGPEVTEGKEVQWRQEIREKNAEVQETNGELIDLVEERSRALLERYGDSVRQVLRDKIPADRIDEVISALTDPQNAFLWFEARIEGRERYFLGHESALAVNVIQYLLEQEVRGETKDLLGEYILHEALERTGLEHRDIIELTNVLFDRPAFERPGLTPLGKTLREFINDNVPLFSLTPSILTEEGEVLRLAFEGEETDDFEEKLDNYRIMLEFPDGEEALIQTTVIAEGSYGINNLAMLRPNDPRIGKPRLFVIREQLRVDEESAKLIIASLADDIVNAYFFGGLSKVTIVATRELQGFIERQLEYAFSGISDDEIRKVAPKSASFIIAQRGQFSSFTIQDMVEFKILEDGVTTGAPIYIKKDGQIIKESIDIETKNGVLTVRTEGEKQYAADLNNLPSVRISGYREDIPNQPSDRIPGTIISLGDGTPAAGRPTTGLYISLVPGKYAAIADTGFGTYENFRRLKESGAIPATERLIVFYSHGHLDHVGDMLQFLLNEDVTVVAAPVVMEQLKAYFASHLMDIRKEGFDELSSYARNFVTFEDTGFDTPSFLYLNQIVDDYDASEIGYDVELAAFTTRQPPYNWMYRFRQVNTQGKPIGYKIGFTGDMKYDKELDAKHQGGFSAELAGAIDTHREGFLDFIGDLDVLIVEWGAAAVIHNTTENVRDLIRDIRRRREDGAYPKILTFHYNEDDPDLPKDIDMTLMRPGTTLTPGHVERHAVTIDDLKFFNILRAIFKTEDDMNRFLGEMQRVGASIVFFSKDTEIASEGVYGSQAFFLVNGRAEVAREGRTFNLTPGNIIGENIVRGELANATVTAREGSIVIILDKVLFDRMNRDVREKLESGLERISNARIGLRKFIELHRESQILAGASSAIIADLALLAEEVKRDAGETIVREGGLLSGDDFADADSLTMVAEGSLEVREEGGTVVTKGPGEVLLEKEIIDAERRDAISRVSTRAGPDGVTLYRLKRDDLDFMEEFYPALYWFIFSKTRQLEAQTEALKGLEALAKAEPVALRADVAPATGLFDAGTSVAEAIERYIDQEQKAQYLLDPLYMAIETRLPGQGFSLDEIAEIIEEYFLGLFVGIPMSDLTSNNEPDVLNLDESGGLFLFGVQIGKGQIGGGGVLLEKESIDVRVLEHGINEYLTTNLARLIGLAERRYRDASEILMDAEKREGLASILLPRILDDYKLKHRANQEGNAVAPNVANIIEDFIRTELNIPLYSDFSDEAYASPIVGEIGERAAVRMFGVDVGYVEGVYGDNVSISQPRVIEYTEVDAERIGNILHNIALYLRQRAGPSVVAQTAEEPVALRADVATGTETMVTPVLFDGRNLFRQRGRLDEEELRELYSKISNLEPDEAAVIAAKFSPAQEEVLREYFGTTATILNLNNLQSEARSVFMDIITNQDYAELLNGQGLKLTPGVFEDAKKYLDKV